MNAQVEKTIISLIQTDLTPARFMIGMSSFLWAAMTFLPGDLFRINREVFAKIFANEQILNLFLFSEHLWATMFLIHSLVIFCSIFLNRTGSKALFYLDGMFGTFLWTSSVTLCFISHMVAWADYQPPTVLAAGVTIAVAQWWNLTKQWATLHHAKTWC